jgi:ABC-2 type transport system permease protein
MTGHGLVLSSVLFAAVRAILAGRGADAPISNPHAAQVIAAPTLLVPICALVGLAIGSIVRHSASSIVGTVVVLMLLPVLLTRRYAWWEAVERSLPHNAWYHLSAEQLAGPMNGVPPTNAAAWTVYALWAAAAATVAILAVKTARRVTATSRQLCVGAVNRPTAWRAAGAVTLDGPRISLTRPAPRAIGRTSFGRSA